MFKNRSLIVLGLLSLLLVAMAISRPASADLSWPVRPVIASDDLAIQRGRQADAARLTAMGEYYQNKRSQEAYAARLTAMGEYFQNKQSQEAYAARLTGQAGQYQTAQAIQKGRLADALRWKAIAEFHTKIISAGP